MELGINIGGGGKEGLGGHARAEGGRVVIGDVGALWAVVRRGRGKREVVKGARE